MRIEQGLIGEMNHALILHIISWRDVPGYVLAQLIGAFFGVAAAHGMFDLPFYAASTHVRNQRRMFPGLAELNDRSGLLSCL